MKRLLENLRILRDNLRALPKPVWILFGGTFINRFGTFVMPFLAIYMTREGFTPTEAGLAVSSYGAGHICASMLGGHLADRIGRRHTIALSMFGSAGSMLALSQVHTLPLLLTLAFVVGLVGELYRPAAAALLGDLVTPEQRVAAFGMYRFAINLGFAVGPATAGFLANRSFFYVFAGDAITSFLFGIVALVALPHGLRSSGKEEKAAEGLRVAFSDRRFTYFLAATMCMTWIEFQLHSTFPLHIAKLGYSPSTYGLLLSINGALIVLLELLITAWTQRLPPQPLIALGYGLTGLGVAMTGLANGVPFLAFTVVIWTLGEMTYAPVTGAFVTTIAPERYRGRYMGIWHSTWSFGMILGPSMGMVIYERNPAALWITCFFLGLVAAGLALVKPSAPPTLADQTAPLSP
ncbi:MAG TPA: MFS transporter [Thermoanaerobaculia bacterium]|nr:MFS transporter [Thermoanaerobaculia bacterium]